MVAAMEGWVAVVGLVAERGAVLDSRDSWGTTALMWAAVRSSYKIKQKVCGKCDFIFNKP